MKIKLNLKRLSDTNEWKVTVSENGKYQEGPSYYGMDKDDAVATALHMIRHYEYEPHERGIEIELGKALQKAIDDGFGQSRKQNPARRGKKMAKRRKKTRKRSKAAIRRERLRNLAKARRARKSGGRRRSRRKSPRRRRNFARAHSYGVDHAGRAVYSTGEGAGKRRVYRVTSPDGQTSVRYLSVTEAALLSAKRYRVKPLKGKKARRKSAKKRRAAKRTRRTASKIRKARKGRRRSKASIRRERLRNLAKARRTRARRAGKRRARPTKHSSKRKSRRAARRTRRTTRKAHRARRGRKRSKASIRRERLRNLVKARRAQRRKSGKRSRRRSRVVGRAVRYVKRRRRISSRRIRPHIARDYRSARHRRGRNRVSRLGKDAIFGLDFRRAVKRQRLGGHRMSKFLRRLGRHPSHQSQRRTSKSTRRGWREFAGTKPNMVAQFKSSPVNGSFNGVLIDELRGTGANSGRSIAIKPPKNAPLYFIWTAGGRSFEVVGPLNAMASLAKGLARAGEPIKLHTLNYLAATYPSPAGVRRTGKERMHVAYTHKIKHKAYLSWNQKAGSKARFPIIVRGAHGQGLVNRSGILL